MHLPRLSPRRRAALSLPGGDALPATPPRERRRRGGPRTPLPLLPIIAVCAGVGLAYVNQTAKATQDNYNEAHLIYQNQQLTTLDQQMGDQLASLSGSSRIIAEARKLGMVTGGTWTYAEAPAAGHSTTVTATAPRPASPAAEVGGPVAALTKASALDSGW
jgi:hypothetical protein